MLTLLTRQVAAAQGHVAAKPYVVSCAHPVWAFQDWLTCGIVVMCVVNFRSVLLSLNFHMDILTESGMGVPPHCFH